MIVLRDIFGRERGFAPPADIKIAASNKYRTRKENFHDAKLLLIFSGSKQKTWLMATTDGLYLVMDRLKEEFPRAIWRIDRADISKGNRVEIPIRVSPYLENTGKVTIADKNERMFTRELFLDATIESRITRLVEEAFSSIG